MSQRGKIRFELGFEVEYTGKEGKFETFNAIDLSAPGLKYFDFHTTMEGWMAEAMFSMAGKMEGLEKMMASVSVDEAREKVAQKGGSGQLEMIKGGLKHEEYSKFLAYLRVHLTNKPLARVADTNKTINADLWEAIADQGGLKIMMEVMGTYLDFFKDTQTDQPIKEKRSPALNGSGLSVTPA